MKKLVPVVLLCTLALLSITVVKSLDPPTATVGSVWTTDTGNVGKLNFDSGETVRIHWQADGTVDIELKYIDGTLDKKWTNQPSSGHVDCIPQLGMGKYKIYVTGADTFPELNFIESTIYVKRHDVLFDLKVGELKDYDDFNDYSVIR